MPALSNANSAIHKNTCCITPTRHGLFLLTELSTPPVSPGDTRFRLLCSLFLPTLLAGVFSS